MWDVTFNYEPQQINNKSVAYDNKQKNFIMDCARRLMLKNYF